MSDGRLLTAKARLDQLDWWPKRVVVDNVRIVIAPWLFRLPPWRRFDGFATHRIIFLRAPDLQDGLVTHELCHVWQMQHRPIRMPLSYLVCSYDRNPYERQARDAARVTAGRGQAGAPPESH